MEKKMTCNGDCLRCIYPDCIAKDAEIALFDRRERKKAKAEKSTNNAQTVENHKCDIKHDEEWKKRKNAARREYYSRNKEAEIRRAKEWNAKHREDIRDYKCLWMKAYRAKQKEAAV